MDKKKPQEMSLAELRERWPLTLAEKARRGILTEEERKRWERIYPTLPANRSDEILKAAKYVRAELWDLSLTPLRDYVPIDDKRTQEAIDAVEKAYIVLSEAIDKYE